MSRLFYLSVDLLPEDLELAHLEQVGQVEQRLYLGLVQHLLHRTKVMIWPKHFAGICPPVQVGKVVTVTLSKDTPPGWGDTCKGRSRCGGGWRAPSAGSSPQCASCQTPSQQKVKLGTNIPRTYHIVLLLLLHVRVGRVELVELQQGQVRFQIITCVWGGWISPQY